MRKMQCILVEQIGSFRFTRAPVRPPADGEVLIKVHVAGLCRTDLKLIRSGHRDLVLPRIPAEEVVGTICEIGPGVAGVSTGQRVYVYPGKWCGRCRACAAGAENLCRDMQIMGFHRDGGFAQYVTVPAQSVIPVPDGLQSDAAVFAEPLSCCLNALELAGIKRGMTVGIWGSGPAGTLLFRASKAMGARPGAIEPDHRRRHLIGGYEHCPDRNFDICVVATATKQAYEEAAERLAPRGRLVVFSGLPPSEDILAVSLNRIHYFEQTIVGAYGCCFRHGKQALELISSNRIPVLDMVSHRMKLQDLSEALDLVENRSGMKILLYP